MKPPPRTRVNPNRQQTEPAQQRAVAPNRKWTRDELRRLLGGLRRLGNCGGTKGTGGTTGNVGGNRDLDYEALKKHVPTRSIAEISVMVESLKNRLISSAVSKLKARMLEEKKAREPIDEWTHMASVVSGALEGTLTSALSQMLMVSSTEPCTLRNCDPPQPHRPATENHATDRFVPFRPMPRQPVQGEPGGPVRPFLVLKTPVRTMGPARRLPAPSQVVRVKNIQACPSQQQPPPTAGSSSQPNTTVCQTDGPLQDSSLTESPLSGEVMTSHSSTVQTTQNPTSSSSQVSVSSSAAGPTPVPTTTLSSSSVTSSSSTICPTLPSTTSTTTAGHTRSGQTGRCEDDAPRSFGVKSIVDFEKIYNFLSAIQKPSQACCLTPMESAIVLDLLMSLPEELTLLDCRKLHQHLTQVYQHLSSPVVEVKKTSSVTAADSCQSNPADGHQLHEAQSPPSGDHPADPDVLQSCPPLNPFMVPLELLRRKTKKEKKWQKSKLKTRT